MVMTRLLRLCRMKMVKIQQNRPYDVISLFDNCATIVHWPMLIISITYHLCPPSKQWRDLPQLRGMHTTKDIAETNALLLLNAQKEYSQQLVPIDTR